MGTPDPPPEDAGSVGEVPAVTFVGKVIAGRYRIDKMLGEGGMGAVFLAEHILMRKRVALKLLHPEMSEDEEVLARFRREAESAAHVEHPNVAAATDFGQTEDGAFFLVLEYVEGTSLRTLVEAGPVPPARALHIARQIGLALERAHEAGIIHRDLKPENVMLVQKDDDDSFVKVLDFGIAKVEPHPARESKQPLTRHGAILGTPEYMAPEQALGEKIGPASDLYAVGCMLYEMLTGKLPFDSDDRMAILSMHLVAPVPRMAERVPGLEVPAPIEDLVRNLLEKDGSLRPPSARAFIDGIEQAAARSGVALPSLASSRSLARESFTPGLPAGGITVVPEPAYSQPDALAKTDYGLPAPSFVPLPSGGSAAQTQHGWLANRQLPAFLAPLEKLPRAAAIAILAAPVALLLLLVVILLVRHHPDRTADASGDASTTTTAGGGTGPARKTQATAAQLATAKAAGIPALTALATDLPEDPAVQRQLAFSLREAGRVPEMLRAVRALAAIAPTQVDDELVSAVVVAAQRPETADEAFALLEDKLGARGVDALIDFPSSRATLQARNRATKSLARSEVRAHASPAALVLLEMKGTTACDKRHDLLERAGADGDARVLAVLKTMKNARGCGFASMRDCWPCMRKDDALDDAVKAIDARTSKSPN